MIQKGNFSWVNLVNPLHSNDCFHLAMIPSNSFCGNDSLGLWLTVLSQDGETCVLKRLVTDCIVVMQTTYQTESSELESSILISCAANTKQQSCWDTQTFKDLWWDLLFVKITKYHQIPSFASQLRRKIFRSSIPFFWMEIFQK